MELDFLFKQTEKNKKYENAVDIPNKNLIM